MSAVELGADKNGSDIMSSWGETVPMLLTELPRSNTVGRAGEEYAVVEAPPSKAVKSSSSKSERFILAFGMFPVLCVNKGTGGRDRFWFGLCKFKAVEEDGADEA